jgi:signal transduction histidine kinase
MDDSVWSTQQLAEFVATVSACETEAAAARAAVERAAEALDADVAAIVCRDELIAAVGYAENTEPVGEFTRIQPGAPDSWLNVPGAGRCPAAAVALAYPPGARLVLARSGGLTRQETGLMRGIARTAAMTMRMLSVLDHERAAREEVEWLAREQAALRRVATLVAKAASPEQIFSAVAHELAQLAGADIGLVLRYEADDTTTMVGGWNRSEVPTPIGAQLAIEDEGVAVSVLRTGQPSQASRFNGPPGSVAGFLRQAGVRASSGSPIIVAGRLWGVVITAATRPGGLHPEIERRMPAFTELVATAIANVQARVELRTIAEEQAALRRVATLVARGALPDEVFAAVAQEVGHVLPDADLATVGRYDHDRCAEVVGGWSRAGSHKVVGQRWMLGGQNVYTLVFERNGPARVDDHLTEGPDDVSMAALELGMRSSAGAPISVGGRLWGVIVVASTRENALPPGAEHRLAGFTELVATAIANAAAQAELTASRARIVATADQTRHRIERDLHDGAQQRLVTLALQLRAAQARVPPQHDWLTADLEHVVAGLASTLDELREYARGIHPAILAQGGLAPALRTLARRSPVPVRLDIRMCEQLPENVEVTAYYVISEALANTARHAKASSVQVEIETTGGVLRLVVRDDGVGGADPARGSGLIGLKDRVEATGGTFTMKSRPNEGTRLLIELPVPVDPRAVSGPRVG